MSVFVPAAAAGRADGADADDRTPTKSSAGLEQAGDWTLLDVRDADERAASAIEGSQHIYVGQLNDRWRELDPDRRYTTDVRQRNAGPLSLAGWLCQPGFFASSTSIWARWGIAWKGETLTADGHSGVEDRRTE